MAKNFLFIFAVTFIGVSECITQNEEPCWSSYGGNCIDTDRSYCPSSNLLTGKCPSQPRAIKCCIPYQETKCSNAGGVCQRTDNTCSGQYLTGYCPQQPRNVKCCRREGQGGNTTTSSRKLIVVDPGHGGKDPGAVASDGTKEKDLILKTSLKLKTDLQNKGYEVKLTRSIDVFLTLSRRADLANSWNADLFVSVHFNSAPNALANGVEVYSYPGSTEGKTLASFVSAEISKKTGAKDRNAVYGPRTANFAVLRETNMTAILVEGGFMSNTAELKKLKSDAYLAKIAKGIANGVKKYLG